MTTLDSVSGSFDFGRVVQRTFKVIGQNLALFVVGALVLVSAPAFVGTLVNWKAQVAGNYFSPGGLIGMLVTMAGGLILQGLVIHTVIARLNGGVVSFNASLSAGARFLLPLLGLGILQGLGIMLGMLLLFVPGLILMVVWAVAAPSLVAENRGVFESLQRSRDLTRGHRWSIFGLFVVYFILAMIAAAVIGGVTFAAGLGSLRGSAAATGMAALTPMIVASTLLSSLSNAVQGILGAAGAASVYYELRSTKEGVAPEQMASVFD